MTTPAWARRAPPSFRRAVATLPVPPPAKCPGLCPRLDQRAAVAEAIRSVFNCADRPAAERRLKEIVALYATSAPKLSAWMETNLPQGFAVFALPLAQQLRLRTSNALERVNQELRRRTRVAGLFPMKPRSSV